MTAATVGVRFSFLSGLPREIPKQYESMTTSGGTCPFRKSYPHVAMMQLRQERA